MLGVFYTIGVGFFTNQVLDRTKEKMVKENIFSVNDATLNSNGNVNLCLKGVDENMGDYLFGLEIPINAIKKSSKNKPAAGVVGIYDLSGYVFLKRRYVSKECSAEYDKSNSLKIPVKEIELSFSSEISGAKEARKDELLPKEGFVVYLVTVLNPDTNSIRKGKEIIIVSREKIFLDINGVFIDFEGYKTEGEKNDFLALPLAIIKDVFTYPYYLYLLIKSGG